MLRQTPSKEMHFIFSDLLYINEKFKMETVLNNIMQHIASVEEKISHLALAAPPFRITLLCNQCYYCYSLTCQLWEVSKPFVPTWGVLKDNLVLSTALIMWIGHRIGSQISLRLPIHIINAIIKPNYLVTLLRFAKL